VALHLQICDKRIGNSGLLFFMHHYLDLELQGAVGETGQPGQALTGEEVQAGSATG